MLQRLKRIGSTSLAFLVAAGMFPAGSIITSAADTEALDASDAAFYVTEATCAHSEEKEVIKSYTQEELQELAKQNEENAAYLQLKGDTITVYGVTEYVTVEQLFEDNDISWEECKADGKAFALLAADGFSYAPSYDALDASTKDEYQFYPNLTASEVNVDDAYPVPLCIGLQWDSLVTEAGSEETVGSLAEKTYETAYEGTMRSFIGSLADDVVNGGGTTAGNRMVGGVNELSFVSPYELVHHEAVDATATESGNIEYWECSVCHKKFSDGKAKEPVSDEDIIIPADTVALTITTANCVHSDGEPLYEYSVSDIQALAAENTEPFGYFHITDSKVTVYGVTKYITMDQLFGNAGTDGISWENYKNDGYQLSLIASSDGFASLMDYDILENSQNYQFYPNLTFDSKNLDDCYEVPACIGLEYGSVSLESGSAMTAKEALENACSTATEGVRAFSGSLEEDVIAGGNQNTVAGFRLATGVDTVAFVKYSNSDLVKHEEVAATTEKEGSIEYYECSGCGKKFSNTKATTELTDAEIVIPKLDSDEPGQPGDEPGQPGDEPEQPAKKAQTITLNKESKTIKANKLKKQKVTFTFKVSGAKGVLNVTSSNKTNVKATVSGKKVTVTVKRGTGKGNYTVKVKAKKTDTYKASKEQTFKITVK